MSGASTASSLLSVGDVVRMLALRIDQLVIDLLPAGRREGHEWRCGSIAGESGDSLGVHLTGTKAGIWADFSAEQKGDSLDLVRAVLGLGMGDALAWSRLWLGIEEGDADTPARPASTPSTSTEPASNPDRWRKPWQAARAITGTLAETYLHHRGLRFPDAQGKVLRFTRRHARRNPTGELEHHPALLALLSDVRTGEPCGTINIYLRPDGADRLRDPKGKTSWGRAGGSAVLLSSFDDVTMGLVVGEGLETGISLLMEGLGPVWCCGGAGNLASFPVLAGIEYLTIAADADEPGQKAADAVAARWREAGREAVILAPLMGDWADDRRERTA
jgi:hypothetical protein